MVSEAERTRILEIAEELGVTESAIIDMAVKVFLATYKKAMNK